MPTVFVRTSECNLRCNDCDTKYAYNSGKEMKISQILKKIKMYNCKNICITGGEPLIQTEIYELINKLFNEKYKIIIETNGSLSIKNIKKNKNICVSLDIKTPSSKMHEKMDFSNINLLSKNDQLKFIIKDRIDYDYSKNILKIYKPKTNVFFQPVWGTNIEFLAEWILNDSLNVKLGCQLHKLIWEDKKGH